MLVCPLHPLTPIIKATRGIANPIITVREVTIIDIVQIVQGDEMRIILSLPSSSRGEEVERGGEVDIIGDLSWM
jgi:hypothetical protein